MVVVDFADSECEASAKSCYSARAWSARVRKKGEDEAKRYRRAGENESSGIFKTGAEKQMIIKKPSFLSFHEAVLFPALSACVILKTPV